MWCVIGPRAARAALTSDTECLGSQRFNPTRSDPAEPNIVSCPGVPAPTADTLIGTVRPGPQRPYRVMPPGLLAHLVRVVLTLDHVLPKTISVAPTQDLIEASVQLLHALSVEEDQYLDLFGDPE
jgi:hypothetical protein